MTAEAWMEAGRQLARRHRKMQWEVADWLVSGAALYADQKAVYDAAGGAVVANKIALS